MNFSDALNALKQGGRVKREQWGETVYLELRHAKEVLIDLWVEPDRRVTWTPSLKDILSEGWQPYNIKPKAQKVQVPPNDFGAVMGDK